MNIAIFGATGAIGPVAASHLQSRGHSVRAVGRSPERLRSLGGTEPFVADLADPVAARAAASGMDAILYTVGVPYDRFELHPRLVGVALDAARDAGVRRFISIGTVYPYGRPQTDRVAETHPRQPHTRKGRWRKEQEDLVLGAHDPGGLRTLSLIAPDFFGPTAENSLAHFAIRNILAGKPADLLAPVTTPHEFVYVPDIAPVIGELFERPDAFGTRYNLAGSGTITVRRFAEKLFAAFGRPMRVREAGPMVLRVMGLVNPMMRELVEMSYLYETPVLLDESKLRDLLGDLPKTSYDDGIAATVAAARTAAVAA